MKQQRADCLRRYTIRSGFRLLPANWGLKVGQRQGWLIEFSWVSPGFGQAEIDGRITFVRFGTVH